MASVEEGAEGTISHILRAAFREYFAEEDHFKAQLARKAATAAGEQGAGAGGGPPLDDTEADAASASAASASADGPDGAGGGGERSEGGPSSEEGPSGGGRPGSADDQSVRTDDSGSTASLDASAGDADRDGRSAAKRLPRELRGDAAAVSQLARIDARLAEAELQSTGLLCYLKEQHRAARELDRLEEERLKREGILVNAHIPEGATRLELDGASLSSFGHFASGLMDARAASEAHGERYRQRTGQKPFAREVTAAGKRNLRDLDAAPGYLKQTRTNEVRSGLVRAISRGPNGDLAATGAPHGSEGALQEGKERGPPFDGKVPVTAAAAAAAASPRPGSAPGLRAGRPLGWAPGLGDAAETVHFGGRSASCSRPAAPPRPGPKRRSPPRPSAAQREAEADVQARMTRKAQYRKNPRHDPAAASHVRVLTVEPGLEVWDAAAKRVVSARSVLKGPGAARRSAGDHGFFVAQPPEVVFRRYEAGGTYDAVLRVRNATALSRQIRVLPPSTKHFSVQRVLYPAQQAGLLAPGMACSMVVRFAPDSARRYRDALTVQSEGGSFEVPLEGRFEAPLLDLPELLDCGACLVGAAKSVSWRVTNSGGAGRFRLLREGGGAAEQANSLRAGAFTISPAAFDLRAGETAVLRAELCCDAPGLAAAAFLLAAGDGEARRHRLCATCEASADVRVSHIGDTAFDLADPRVRQPRRVAFPGACALGGAQTLRLSLQNGSDLPVGFRWLTSGAAAQDFRVEPPRGTLPPCAPWQLEVHFAPRGAGERSAELSLHIEGQERPALALDLCGRGAFVRVEIAPQTLHIPGVMTCGAAYEARVHLRNASSVPTRVAFGAAAPAAADLFDGAAASPLIGEVRPREGAVDLLPGETRSVAVAVRPSAPGRLAAALPVRWTGGRGASLRVEGAAAGPRLRILEREVNFGLVAVGGSKSCSMGIANESAAPARWALRTVAAAHGAALEDAPATARSASSDLPSARSRSSLGSDSRAGSFAIEEVQSRVRFLPAGGLLAPGEVCRVEVRCDGGQRPQRLREVAELVVLPPEVAELVAPGPEGSPPSAGAARRPESAPDAPGERPQPVTAPYGSAFVSLRGEVQSPAVFLDSPEVDAGVHFVDVPVSRTLTLVNLSNLETRFRWERPGVSLRPSRCDVAFDPPAGVLRGKERRAVHVTLTSRSAGPVDELLACRVFGLRSPLGVALSGEARGAAVSVEPLADAEAPPAPLATPSAPQLPSGAPPPPAAPPPALDLGEGVALFSRSSRKLVLRNLSAVPSLFRLRPRRLAIAPPRADRFASGAARARTSAFWCGELWRIAEAGPEPTPLAATRLEHMHDALRRHREGAIRAAPAAAASAPAAVGSLERAATAATAAAGASPGCAGSAAGGGAAGAMRLLDNKLERRCAFTSARGAEHALERLRREEDAWMLAEGRGAAFAVVPACGVLAPWGVCEVEVTSFNDMPGQYRDEILATFGSAAPTPIPVALRVDGCPIALRGGTVGLRPPRDPSAGRGSWAAMPTLCFGDLPVGSPAAAKTLCVLNEGPVPARLSWKLREPREDRERARPLRLSISPGRGGGASIALRVAFREDVVSAPPFGIHPPSALLLPRDRAEFQVLLPELPGEGALRAVLTADAEWVPAEGAADLAAPARRGVVPCVLSVGVSAAGVAPRLDLDKKAWTTKGGRQYLKFDASAEAAALCRPVLRRAVRSGEREAAACASRGLPAAVVAAASMRPLQDALEECPGAKGALARTFSLTNSRGVPLHFQLFCAGPRFQVTAVESPNAAAFGARSAAGPPASIVASPSDYNALLHTLNPRDTMLVTVLYLPSAEALGGLPPRAERLPSASPREGGGAPPAASLRPPERRLRREELSTLQILYTTGTRQEVTLRGQVTRPAVLAAPSLHDFGAVHVEGSAAQTLFLTNPTHLPARWRIAHVPVPPGREEGAGALDDPGAFAFSDTGGVLRGPSLPLESAAARLPEDRNRRGDAIFRQTAAGVTWRGADGAARLSLRDAVAHSRERGGREPVAVEVRFRPTAAARYRCRFKVEVEHGEGFELVLQGEGTYDEHRRPEPPARVP